MFEKFEKIRQEKLKYISLIGSVIGALLGIIATSINHSIRKRDLNSLTRSLEKQIDQDNDINFFTNELKKIIYNLDQKLEFTLNNNSNDNELNDYQVNNDATLKKWNSLNDQLNRSTFDYKFNNALLGCLILLTLYDIFINK